MRVEQTPVGFRQGEIRVLAIRNETWTLRGWERSSAADFQLQSHEGGSFSTVEGTTVRAMSVAGRKVTVFVRDDEPSDDAALATKILSDLFRDGGSQLAHPHTA